MQQPHYDLKHFRCRHAVSQTVRILRIGWCEQKGMIGSPDSLACCCCCCWRVNNSVIDCPVSRGTQRSVQFPMPRSPFTVRTVITFDGITLQGTACRQNALHECNVCWSLGFQTKAHELFCVSIICHGVVETCERNRNRGCECNVYYQNYQYPG